MEHTNVLFTPTAGQIPQQEHSILGLQITSARRDSW